MHTFTFTPDPFRLHCLPAEANYHEISLVLDRIFYRYVNVYTIRSSYCLSTPIYIWAGTSGSHGQGQGFSSVTMAQEYLHRVHPQTKSSVPNGAAKRLAKERSVFASPTSAGVKVNHINKVPATASSHNLAWISSTSWLDKVKASIS